MARQHQSKGLSRPCVFLIVIAGMERFAFKGLASNLVTYLTDVVNMSNSSAAKTVNNWCGLTFIMPLLVAPLADFLWDRYSTILFSSLIYAVGLVAVTSTAFSRIWFPAKYKTASSLFLFLSLSLISLGQGGYNPSLQAFAADQLVDEVQDDELPLKEFDDDEQPIKKNRFFSCWYIGICSGSLLGVSLMAYVQDFLGWGLGFAIPTMVMVTSILLLSTGSRFYAYKQDSHNNEKPFKRIIRAANVGMSKIVNCGAIHSSATKENKAELELQKESLCKLDFADVKDFEESPNTLLLNVKVVLRLLPIWTTLLIFAVIFQQPVTFFTKQGMTMKRNIGNKLMIPPATLQSAITISILVLMPLYDKMFIPLTRMITRNKKGISTMQRMGIGMLLSTVAMIIAALVEEKRLKMSKETEDITSETGTVPLSIFWLLPQYILLGVSDIFTVVGMQEFFYSEVPVNMRTTGLALNTSVYGVGSFLSALLIAGIELFTSSSDGKTPGGWFSDDMREARIDKYYRLLAVFSVLSVTVYAFLCKCHKSINKSTECSK